jgi:hypothetical protein
MGTVHPLKYPMRRVVDTWWPLAASWIMMSLEGPAVSAVVARLANPEINLAAYSIVFSLALIVESPIIMLLAASTALSKDWDSFTRLRRYMMTAGALLTTIHLLVAFTPLFDIIVRDIIGAPGEILEPARIGFRILLPWTWSIAFRRFNQGVLIRFGRSQIVGTGTIVRLAANLIVLSIGYLLQNVDGIVLGTLAVSAGVMGEAGYVGLAVRPVLRGPLKLVPPQEQPITLQGFFQFYIPLVMTSLLFLLAQPIGNAAVSRMPMALESLAVWPVISGLVFLFRSLGMAYNEVVVALLDEPLASGALWRFTAWLAGLTSLVLFIVTVTPIARFWFERLSALPPDLTALAQGGLWFAIPQPAMAFLQSWYQGAILNGKRTRGISEAVVIYLVSIVGLLAGFVLWSGMIGLHAVMAVMGISMALQTFWLWLRSRSIIQEIVSRDTAMEGSGVSPQIRATNIPG